MFGIVSRSNDSPRVQLIPTSKIRPNPAQPRRVFDDEALYGLAESIRQNGILQPLSVRALPEGNFELVACERRLRAAMLCGLPAVPCIEMELDDSQSAVLALIENLQREDLGFFEEAEGIARLVGAFNLTQTEVARRLGKTQSTVANKLRLLRLPESVRRRILEAGLTERHARALLRLDSETCEKALDTIVAKKFNVFETEHYIDHLLEPKSGISKPRFMPVIKDVRLFVNTMQNAINVMRKAGVDAITMQQEHEEYYEYIVRIPKFARHRKTS